MKITTPEQLIELFQSVYYLESTESVVFTAASWLTIRIPGSPFWAMIVGGSSSGKTELLNSLMDMPNTHLVSQLTENTLLSGAKLGPGEEASLLKRVGKTGTIVFKDFTSILSMGEEKQLSIMGQLRETFDGKLVKIVGNSSKPIEWEGKINVFGAVTEEIHVVGQKFSSMGTRMVYYNMPDQDRVKTMERALSNQSHIEKLRKKVKDGMTSYLTHVASTKLGRVVTLPTPLLTNIIEVADFCSHARSAITRNKYNKNVEFVHTLEMPMRMGEQMQKLGTSLMYMYDDNLPQNIENIIYKIGFDSIPKQRLQVLKELARHRSINSTACAMALHMPTKPVGMVLDDLNMLGLMGRYTSNATASATHQWKLDDKYRPIMEKHFGVKSDDMDVYENELPETTEGFYGQVTAETEEEKEVHDNKFDSIFGNHEKKEEPF